MNSETKGCYGCLAFVLAAPLLFVALLQGYTTGVLITLAVAALLVVAALTVRYVREAPRRRAEEARRKAEEARRRAEAAAEQSLRQGNLCEGMPHFWQTHNDGRIRSCLRSVRLPARGVMDWVDKTDAPRFRKLLLSNFEQMVALRDFVYLPANGFIPDDLKESAYGQLTKMGECMWEIAQRLSVQARDGVMANDAQLRASFKKAEQTLKNISNKLTAMRGAFRQYVAEPHRYEMAARRALDGVDEVVGRVNQQTEYEREVAEIEKRLTEGDKTADELMREARSKQERGKEPLPRRPKSE